MKKEELIIEVSKRTGLRQTQVSSMLESTLDIIVEELGSGGEVMLQGFGKFHTKDRAPKRMVNPSNGEVYQIPQRRVAVFKTGSRLSEV